MGHFYPSTPADLTFEATVDPLVDAKRRLVTASLSVDSNGVEFLNIVPQPVATAAVAGFQVAKAAPGTLYGLNVVAGAAAGFIMLFDAVAAPADGAVTPKKVIPLAANGYYENHWDRGLKFAVGIVVVYSTTGPYAKTISNTAFIETEVA